MDGLSDFELAVLNKLLAGKHPVLTALRLQCAHARLARREHTGAGFYCEFKVIADVPTLFGDLQIGDVEAELEGTTHGAGFLLLVRGGRISMLEGYTYDEPWPDKIRGYSLKYSDPERRAELAKLG